LYTCRLSECRKHSTALYVCSGVAAGVCRVSESLCILLLVVLNVCTGVAVGVCRLSKSYMYCTALYVCSGVAAGVCKGSES